MTGTFTNFVARTAGIVMAFSGLTGCGSVNVPALATLSDSLQEGGRIVHRAQAPSDDRQLLATANTAWVTPPAQSTLVTQHTFRSAAANSDVSYHLYLPPVYRTQPWRRFQVLYWLHGTDGGLTGIPKLAEHFDRGIREGKMPPTIVVFPNGRKAGMWVNSKNGATPVETVLVKELLPLIDRNLRTIATRDGRILEGFSMGGYGAGRIGLSYPNLFSRVSMLAGGPIDLDFQGPRALANPEGRDAIFEAVYSSDIKYYQFVSPIKVAERQASVVSGRIRLRMAVGEADFTFENNTAFHNHLQSLGIAHRFTSHPGVTHNTLDLLAAMGDAAFDIYR